MTAKIPQVRKYFSIGTEIKFRTYGKSRFDEVKGKCPIGSIAQGSCEQPFPSHVAVEQEEACRDYRNAREARIAHQPVA